MRIHPILISRKDFIAVILCTFLILLLPFFAMQFSQEVNWQISDFVLAGLILCFFGYTYKVLTKTSVTSLKKVVCGMLVLGALAIFWISLI